MCTFLHKKVTFSLFPILKLTFSDQNFYFWLTKSTSVAEKVKYNLKSRNNKKIRCFVTVIEKRQHKFPSNTVLIIHPRLIRLIAIFFYDVPKNSRTTVDWRLDHSFWQCRVMRVNLTSAIEKIVIFEIVSAQHLMDSRKGAKMLIISNAKYLNFIAQSTPHGNRHKIPRNYICYFEHFIVLFSYYIYCESQKSTERARAQCMQPSRPRDLTLNLDFLFCFWVDQNSTEWERNEQKSKRKKNCLNCQTFFELKPATYIN